MKDKPEPFWQVIDTKKGFKGEWIDLDVDSVRLPDGKMIEFEALRYHRNGAAVAAENDKGEFILVKNYRYINEFTGWEVPAGTVPPDEHHSDVVLQELKEEAGCEAKKEDLTYLGNYYASIGSSSQMFHCYHAVNVKKTTDEIDTNEIQEARWFTREELKKMIRNYEIKDGFSLNLLMRVIFDKELNG